jgi:hypothetical protein
VVGDGDGVVGFEAGVEVGGYVGHGLGSVLFSWGWYFWSGLW